MNNLDLFDSWKKISEYLGREVRTCVRWEKELGLPIHRIDKNSSRSKVFAYKSEIDAWLMHRANHNETGRSFLQKKSLLIALVPLMLLILIALGFLFFRPRNEFSLSPKDETIAIFPIKGQNFADHEEYISEGIATEIANRLAISSAIKVIPVFLFPKNKEIPKDTKRVYGKLGATYVLQGNIKKENDNFKLSVELIRAKDGKRVWKSEFEENEENILSVLNQACQKLIELINDNTILKSPATYSMPRNNNKAFENYLKGSFILNRLARDNSDPWKLYYQGKFYWNIRTRESNDLAINLFNQAIELDRYFAQAYIGLAYCYLNYVNFNWDFNIKWLNKAEDLLRIGQAICPDLPEYFSALIAINLLKEICFSEPTMNMAFKLANEAIKRYPNHNLINSITGYCYYLRFGEEGKEADLDKALEYKKISHLLNPFDFYNVVYAELLMIKGDFNNAIHVCSFIEKCDASLIAKFKLGEIYYFMGDVDKSQNIFGVLENSWDLRISSLFYLGMIAAQQHEREKAVAIVKKITSEGKNAYEGEIKLSSIFFGLGNEELGRKYLGSFLTEPNVIKRKYIYLRYIDMDRNFDKFRQNIRRSYYAQK
jgi:TolB-like protein